ncbi:amino-acid N-acetyltransferase subunit Mak10 [Histoplasma capsulatum H143]|uniref:Amino-acid N-acetyltransferase subunit Mak10 n=1 Tax=Ajellomyces capsulatus (strain H143) TaxID=544712 RepID=C6HGI1_AJECH|nr:amino-acid N-acetyltransferase subunit Mak10 [Histoplasma capsulatum H143]
MSVKDITAAFTKASSVLNTGQLVKDEFFTLFEAIMDEKMDSGYLAPGETLDDDYDISRRLSPAEVVGIMDQLLSHEVAWHSGHPLSQTLFTSIYLDRMLWPVPKSLKEAKFDRSGMTEHKKEEEKEGDEEDGSKGQWNELVDLVLRAYCLALIKACDRINSKVCSEYFHEEEDFVTQLYNRNLLADVGSDPIQLILDDALSWLDRQKQEQSGAVDEPIREALVHRLLFRRELLSGLDVDTMPAKQRSIQPFLAALRHLGRIEKSMHLGKSVPEAFSWKIQRRLASTVPPRPMVHVSAADAIAHMTRFCQDAVDVQQILEYRGPYNLQTFVWALQSRKPQPCAYIRSLVQSLIVNDMEILGSVDVKYFFFDSLAELVLPHNQLLDRKNEEVEAPSDSRFQIAKHMDNFVKKAAQPFVDTYRTTCLNRCRVRRTLCHAIVDWDALQAEPPLTYTVQAEDFDVHLCTLTLEPPIVLHGNEPTYSYPLSTIDAFAIALHALYVLLSRYQLLQSTYIASSTPSTQTHPQRQRPSYSSDHLRYELRMKPFLAISLPELVPFDTFEQESGLVGVSDADVLERASRAIAEAKRGVERCLMAGASLEVEGNQAGSADGDGDGDGDGRDVPDEVPDEKERKRQPAKMDGKGKSAKPEPEPDPEPRPRLLQDDWTGDMKDSLRACIGASIAIGTVKKAISASAPAGASNPDGDENHRPKLNLSVDIPPVGSKGRWHDWWAVPRVTEVLPLRGSG